MSLKQSLFSSSLMRITSAGLTFLGSIVLARVLGADYYGDYVLVLSWITLFFVVSTAGLPNLMLREISLSNAENRPDLTKGMLLSGLGTFVVLLALCGAFYLLARSIGIGIDGGMGWMAWATVLLWGMALLLESATRGLGATTVGQVGELLLRPGGILIFMLVLRALMGAETVTSDTALIALFIATGLSAGFALVTFWRVQGGMFEVAATYRSRDWLIGGLYNSSIAVLIKSSFPLSFLLLGYLAGTSEVGIYRVGYQLSMAASIGLLAAKAVIAPQIARSLTYGGQQEFRTVYVNAIKSCLLFSVPICVILLIAPEFILGTLFGPEYYEAANATRILAFTVLVNSLFGPIDVILEVKRADRTLSLAAVLRVVLYLGLVALLVPYAGPFGGIAGVAIAQLVSTLAWFLVMLPALKHTWATKC